MTEQDYIDYFEELARRHTAIGHTVEQPRFHVVRQDNLTELTKAVRSRLLLPCVVIDQYYDELLRTNDNYRLRIQGGLSILVRCQQSSPDDLRRAQAEARTIALSFVNRMYADSRKPGTVLAVRRVTVATEFTGEPYPVVAEIATGWGYAIDWLVPTTVPVDPADWSDCRTTDLQ